MAERDQLVGALRRKDTGDARRAEHVALLGVAGQHRVQRLFLHDDPTLGNGDALGRALGRYVDHTGLAAASEMGEFSRADHVTRPRARDALLAAPAARASPPPRRAGAS